MKYIIEVTDLKTVFGDKIVHEGLNLKIKEGEIYGIVGPSGSGKTTLIREMLMLQEIDGGTIKVLGYNLSGISYKHAQELRQQWGVLFQAGALFSSLNIRENIALPLIEYSDLPRKLIDEIVDFKLSIVGLKSSDASLFPSQLSGGMKKKASLARALAMDPKLLFLDEPTSGLDPISARDFDALILKLRDILKLTVVMVSHDLQSIYDTINTLAVIDNKKIIYDGSVNNISTIDNEFIKTFFKGYI
ncbi:ATP-binding cassette domain-containing protein [Sulfurimonas sp.]|jgi:phospholipid/cholesterol/gamma-HCH transport system ATP-binding protein|uniref:ABC transporter ATP-binding protein n=1 Tax=Sulfurimonas sp. TaxID=2022749 RepID=UPI002600C266|nr:ATP-binding cassette domain-containing protein [Sulfurimonas sp.]MCK9473870.1 ATP-binding cassette domain-containing protein [Sulfurimonas sp.]MDD3505311.1 ATP-binding cassette domain-containing protein [Sulfurimonas sp.]